MGIHRIDAEELEQVAQLSRTIRDLFEGFPMAVCSATLSSLVGEVMSEAPDQEEAARYLIYMVAAATATCNIIHGMDAEEAHERAEAYLATGQANLP